MGARRSRLLRASLRVAAVTVVFLLALELVLRLFGYGDYILYAPDRDLLWLPLPSQRGKTVAGRLPITINAAGLRHPEDFDLGAGGEVRIFAFGDSVTQGWGVDDRSHFSAVLERRLAVEHAGSRARVVSAGVNAYPTALCVRRFEKLVEGGADVDLAILAYSFNHNYEHLARLAGEERDAFLRKVRVKGILRRFALYNFLVEDLLRQAVYYRVRTRLIEGSWSGAKPSAAETAADVEAYVADLEAMAETGERHGVPVAFLLLGSRDQRSSLDEHQAAFREFALRRGLPLVDMVAELRAEDHGELFMDHNHPSPAGHRRIAAALHELLVARDLLAPAAER